MRQRDSQRSKVYAAERRAACWFKNSETFCEMTFEDFNKKVLEIVRDPRLLQRYPFLAGRTPEIMIKAAVSGAYQCGNRVVFGPRMMKTWVIIHELTHWVLWQSRRAQTAKWLYENPEPAGHGWEFCKAYIDMAGLFLSYKEMDLLKECFRKEGVRYKAPRQLSEATIQMLRERMTKMQQEKKAATRS